MLDGSSWLSQGKIAQVPRMRTSFAVLPAGQADQNGIVIALLPAGVGLAAWREAWNAGSRPPSERAMESVGRKPDSLRSGPAHAVRWPTPLARVLGLALAVGMAAFASMAPPYERPHAPVPESYPADTVAAAPAAAVFWRDYFTDDRLRSLIDLALAHNRDLRAAVLRVGEARAAYRQRAEGTPVVTASVNAARARLPGSGFTGRPLDIEQVVVGAGISSWELDFWGRVRSMKDAALEDYLATDAARRAAALSLVAEIGNGYLALRELDERLALARQTAASRAASLHIFRRRVDVGATSKLELLQVEALWQQATALLTQLELSRATQAHALELIGTTADLSPVPARLDDAALFQALEPGLPSELLTRRPDIVASEHALKAANADIGAARAAFFPRIGLIGLLGLASSELDDLFSTDSRAWIFSPSLMLPIFRRRASPRLARSRPGASRAGRRALRTRHPGRVPRRVGRAVRRPVARGAGAHAARDGGSADRAGQARGAPLRRRRGALPRCARRATRAAGRRAATRADPSRAAGVARGALGGARGRPVNARPAPCRRARPDGARPPA